MTTRKIAMLVNTDIQLSAAITARPDVEVYQVASEDDIDMALLTDLVVPCKLAFVGKAGAKTLATLYGATWIEDSATVENDLVRFWDLA